MVEWIIFCSVCQKSDCKCWLNGIFDPVSMNIVNPNLEAKVMKYKFLTVTLDSEYDEEDLPDVLCAISMVRGVQEVKTNSVASVAWHDAFQEAKTRIINQVQGVPRG